MKWILVLLVIFGDWLVIKKDTRGFYIWMLVDGSFCISSAMASNWQEMVTFGSYALIAVYGTFSWKK